MAGDWQCLPKALVVVQQHVFGRIPPQFVTRVLRTPTIPYLLCDGSGYFEAFSRLRSTNVQCNNCHMPVFPLGPPPFCESHTQTKNGSNSHARIPKADLQGFCNGAAVSVFDWIWWEEHWFARKFDSFGLCWLQPEGLNNNYSLGNWNAIHESVEICLTCHTRHRLSRKTSVPRRNGGPESLICK